MSIQTLAGNKVAQEATTMSMNELVKTIGIYKSHLKILEDIKNVRIRDGEKTDEMIRREAKKLEKAKEKQTEQAKSIKKPKADATDNLQTTNTQSVSDVNHQQYQANNNNVNAQTVTR